MVVVVMVLEGVVVVMEVVLVWGEGFPRQKCKLASVGEKQCNTF